MLSRYHLFNNYKLKYWFNSRKEDTPNKLATWIRIPHLVVNFTYFIASATFLDTVTRRFELR